MRILTACPPLYPTARQLLNAVKGTAAPTATQASWGHSPFCPPSPPPDPAAPEGRARAQGEAAVKERLATQRPFASGRKEEKNKKINKNAVKEG